ncbi:MAG: acetolactate synthase, large subunit, biosynthetic type, partial [Clostridiales bacterium 43-6]
GYPGAAICPFYDALLESSVRHVLVRQEQNAGHAASGYARASGKAGVCVTTSGPGATNLITAVASAYMDSIPMVAITGQVSTELLGRDVFQEIDITGACEPFTKHSYIVMDTEDLGRVFREAFHIATTGRPGPVLIDIPVNIQTKCLESFVYPETVDIVGYKPSRGGHSVQIKRAAQAIQAAEKPVICAGGGIFSAKAQKALIQFAEKTDIPVVCTMMGIGAMPTAHPLNLGMLGSHGVKAANVAIHQADLILLCGARVGDRAMASPDQIASRAKIVHIDIDPAEIGKNMAASIPIVGDIKLVLKSLCDETETLSHTEWAEQCRKNLRPAAVATEDTGFVNPKAFMRLLSEKMQDDAILVADVGQNQIWSANNFTITKGRFLTSGGLGTMGYSVGAAIGAKAASPDKQVCAVCGDGSFQMQMMELATMCQHDIPVKIIVMRNGRLGMVRELQFRGYHARYSGVFLEGSPDFIKIAEAYGIAAKSIHKNSETEQAIEEMLQSKTPYLLECVVDPDETAQ